MGVGKSEKKNYLTISYGKLRQRTTESDPEAQSRYSDTLGKEIWERVYNWVEGKITSIFYKESKEYGNSFEVTLDDGKDRFNISFKEKSRYCTDFLSKLPNIDLDSFVRITPYDFIPEGKESAIMGVSLKQFDKKIENHFVSKDEKGNIIYKSGFPKWQKDMDDDEFQMYLVRLRKFLRNYTKENIIPKLTKPTEEKIPEDVPEPVVEENDDLPF